MEGSLDNIIQDTGSSLCAAYYTRCASYCSTLGSYIWDANTRQFLLSTANPSFLTTVFSCRPS